MIKIIATKHLISKLYEKWNWFDWFNKFKAWTYKKKVKIPFSILY